jgi:hypothetical protein
MPPPFVRFRVLEVIELVDWQPQGHADFVVEHFLLLVAAWLDQLEHRLKIDQRR